MILCRNVLIYFDRTLQNRVHGLFYDSLVHVRRPRARAQGVAPRSRGTRTRYEELDAAEKHLPEGRDERATSSSWSARRGAGSTRCSTLLGGLPADFAPPSSSCSTAPPSRRDGARASCCRITRALPVREAEDKDAARAPGTSTSRPPDYHLLVEHGHLALSTDAPVRFSRPSIDVLFESAADAYGERVRRRRAHRRERRRRRGPRAHRRRAAASAIVQDPGDGRERATMPRRGARRACRRRRGRSPLDEIAAAARRALRGVARGERRMTRRIASTSCSSTTGRRTCSRSRRSSSRSASGSSRRRRARGAAAAARATTSR